MEKNFLDILQEITKKDLSELTDYEIAFLKARFDYLNDEEKERYLNILNTDKTQGEALKCEISNIKTDERLKSRKDNPEWVFVNGRWRKKTNI